MLKKIAGFLWEKTPYFVRARAVRLTQTKFTVSVAAVVTNQKNEILLLDHVLRPFTSWGVPGGFVNRGEQPERAVRRELREEIGLELKNLRIARVRTIGRHVEILFRAEADGKPVVKSREINDLGWFVAAHLPDRMSRAQQALVREILDAEI